MRCLLINPFYPLSENPSPPLGLAYLAAALEKAGVEVEILDFVVFPYIEADFRSKLEQFNPDIVAATAVTMTFDRAIRIIQEARRWSSRLPDGHGRSSCDLLRRRVRYRPILSWISWFWGKARRPSSKLLRKPARGETGGIFPDWCFVRARAWFQPEKGPIPLT